MIYVKLDVKSQYQMMMSGKTS